MKSARIMLPLLLFGVLLSACSFLLEFDSLREREPFDYYLFAPPNYTGESTWPAFIAIQQFGSSGRDCLRTWMQYAEEHRFILVCPTLASAGGSWLQSEAELQIVAILGAVSQDYNIRSKTFYVGFSAGAQFVIGYSFTYPDFVSGVSIISTSDYFPLTSVAARRIPFLITVGDQDPNRIDVAKDFNALLTRSGFSSDYYILEGVEHEISASAINLTLRFFDRVGR